MFNIFFYLVIVLTFKKYVFCIYLNLDSRCWGQTAFSNWSITKKSSPCSANSGKNHFSNVTYNYIRVMS